MAGNPIGWFEIYVEDIARAARFYETVLDLRLERLDSPAVPMWTFPTAPDRYGCSGALVQLPNVPAAGSRVMIYFSCEDCAVEAARAAEAGGQIVRPKMAIGAYGFVVLVRDTEGNLIGLHSQA
ncbi:MAG TPA: VOC family protein [Dokdonella sp.]|uniref:VOC family protein n=1 Tax=Dokdonella sp. TaxID=2291710 RepID=UPI002B90CF7F|nr:VOC family protein [Dokdonella sp.]HUD41986.1 VOC family protein [Dokdonella sp.]